MKLSEISADLLVFCIAFSAFGLAVVILNFYRDIKFYSSNNWDLKKESGVSISFGSGPVGEKISAKERFWIAYPIGFLVPITALTVFSLELLERN